MTPIMQYPAAGHLILMKSSNLKDWEYLGLLLHDDMGGYWGG